MLAAMQKEKTLVTILMKKIFIVLATITMLFELQCSQPSKPESNLSDQYSIYLIGRVTDNNSNPISNAVAKLAGENLSDTTDANGYYCIKEKKTGGLGKVVSVGDSVEIIKDGQVITYLGVLAWIDALSILLSVLNHTPARIALVFNLTNSFLSGKRD